jgi:hypothetical protein
MNIYGKPGQILINCRDQLSSRNVQIHLCIQFEDVFGLAVMRLGSHDREVRDSPLTQELTLSECFYLGKSSVRGDVWVKNTSKEVE